MLRATLRAMLLVPVLALGSCVVENPSVEPEAEPVAEVEEELTPGMSELVGTFTGDPRMAGDLALLVLKTNGTYHTGKLVYCVAAPCPPVGEDGRYRVYQREGISRLTLYTRGNTEVYDYVLRGDTLLLRNMERGARWMDLHRDNTAWCAMPNDCMLQRLSPGPCPGRYQCEANACNFTCRMTDPMTRGEVEWYE
ncbi:MAG: hypothetical protein QM820_49045 [Minicystis sp.]